MTNYASMAKRIRDARTLDDLKKAQISLDRLYNAGIFTVSEFTRLDGLLLDRTIEIGDPEND